MSNRNLGKQSLDVGPNGLTQDYYNEVFSVAFAATSITSNEVDIEKMNKHLKESPIPLYEQVYSGEQYNNVVTNFNRASLLKLDAAVTKINELGAQGELTLELWTQCDKEIKELLYGAKKH